VDQAGLEAGLAQYQPTYAEAFCSSTLKKLGILPDLAAKLPADLQRDLIASTLTLLEQTHVSYPDFFANLTQQFSRQWQTDSTLIFSATVENAEENCDPDGAEQLTQWRQMYQHCLSQLPPEAMDSVQSCLNATNPMTVLLRPQIEAVWAPITEDDNWQPFYDLLSKVQNPYAV
jgi:serine/tyrosine/threonine adenylyltransferase